MKIFKYKISNYDIDDEYKEKLLTNYGIVVANSCSEAISKIEDMYGEENIRSCAIDIIEDDWIKELTEKIYNELKYSN